MPKKDQDIEEEAKRQLEIEKAKKKIKDSDPDTIINRGFLILAIGGASLLIYYFAIRWTPLVIIFALGVILGLILIVFGAIQKVRKNPGSLKFEPMFVRGICDKCKKSTHVKKTKNCKLCIKCMLKR
ncbi:MAG: hypothetical protein HZB65_04590 [Candidatus Aenigmarchaeota archaeon]|nr:hypothetical protein [Candidatus Aenigmarchaeota archaeon]